MTGKTSGSRVVELSWNEIAGATGYDIYGQLCGKYANAKSISVNPTELSMHVGDTAKLKATTKIYKNKKHITKSHGVATKYISASPSIATVSSSGEVTAVGRGTATIYIQDIGGLYCSTTVTVK